MVIHARSAFVAAPPADPVSSAARPRTWPRLRVAAAALAAAGIVLAIGGHDARADELAPPPLSQAGLAPTGPGPAPAPVALPPAIATDHDAVVGHWGIQARRLAAAPYPLALSPMGACPTAPAVMGAPCTLDMGAISVRYWKTRNFAWDLGLAFALGGGRQGSQGLDTDYGLGPIVGATMLLGTWRHLAINANPELSLVYFKPGGGSSPSTKLIAFRAELEGELHFGFIDVPALSIGLAAGMVFQYESAPGASTWSVSLTDARSVWGTLTNLFIRYYL